MNRDQDFSSRSPDLPATFLVPEEIRVPYTKKKVNPPNFGDLRSSNVTGIFNKQIAYLGPK